MGHPVQEYVELHQRYLVRGEDVLNEWHMETIRRRTGSQHLHGPYIGAPEEQKVCIRPFDTPCRAVLRGRCSRMAVSRLHAAP